MTKAATGVIKEATAVAKAMEAVVAADTTRAATAEAKAAATVVAEEAATVAADPTAEAKAAEDTAAAATGEFYLPSHFDQSTIF